MPSLQIFISFGLFFRNTSAPIEFILTISITVLLSIKIFIPLAAQFLLPNFYCFGVALPSDSASVSFHPGPKKGCLTIAKYWRNHKLVFLNFVNGHETGISNHNTKA